VGDDTTVSVRLPNPTPRKQNLSGQIDPGFGQATLTGCAANTIQKFNPGALPPTTGVVNHDVET
jgi:hypothetical protein